MKHWKTEEEMGEGFQHTEKEHKEFEYNSLEETKPHEKNTMRTMYLIRDVWTIEQLCKLQEHLTDTIKERKDNKKRKEL